jgi:hypothetical protein
MGKIVIQIAYNIKTPHETIQGLFYIINLIYFHGNVFYTVTNQLMS